MKGQDGKLKEIINVQFDLISKEEIDKVIGMLIYKMRKIPSIEDIATELEEDPQNNIIHECLFKRLARMKKLQPQIMDAIKKLCNENQSYKEDTNKKGIDRMLAHIEWKGRVMPSNKSIMIEIGTEKSEWQNPAIINLIDLCKQNF